MQATLTPDELRQYRAHAAHLASMGRADAETAALADVLSLRGRVQREGIDALHELVRAGGSVIGVYDSKKYITSGPDIPAAYTADMDTIRALMAGHGDAQGRAKGSRIALFRFEPRKMGLLCLDIDRGHGNGKKDGLEAFYGLFQAGPPSFLANIPAGSYHCYTSTPRGGYHLHFRYNGPDIKRVHIAENVEVFHTQPLTAAGSYKDGKPYILHGDFANALELPSELEILTRLTAIPPPKKEAPRKPLFVQERKYGAPSLDQIAAWTETDKPNAGRNDFCYSFALKAKRQEYGYTPDDVTAYLESYPRTNGHAQIKTTVQSAFKGAV